MGAPARRGAVAGSRPCGPTGESLRPVRRRTPRQTLAAMAEIGRRPASHLPASIARPPDRDLLRRAGVDSNPADVVAARADIGRVLRRTRPRGRARHRRYRAASSREACFSRSAASIPTSGCARRPLGGQARIERAAPELLELVAVAVRAGMPLDAAIDGAARAAGGELAEELERSRVSMTLGRPRGEEFRDLSERTGAPTLAALGLALRLSDRLGVPLADSLRDRLGAAGPRPRGRCRSGRRAPARGFSLWSSSCWYRRRSFRSPPPSH